MAIRRRSGELGVIAELKPRRHEGVDLFRGRSPAEIAGVYRAAAVDALSVVTSSWFGGDLRLLEEVAALDTGLPILRKDLIRDLGDLQASRNAGASAVLLAMPLLGLRRVVELAQSAWEEELEPLVEVATSDEIQALRDAYGGMIAINNSDIASNETQGESIARSLRLIDKSDPRVWISASRIRDADEVRQLADCGFEAVLVGTHLLLAADLAVATRELVAAAHDAGNRP